MLPGCGEMKLLDAPSSFTPCCGSTGLACVLIHVKYEKNREDIGLFGIWRD